MAARTSKDLARAREQTVLLRWAATVLEVVLAVGLPVAGISRVL